MDLPPSEVVQEMLCVQVLLLVVPSEILLALVFFVDKEFFRLRYSQDKLNKIIEHYNTVLS